MSLFQEYMNSRGKVAKPEVDASADRVDPMTPPAAPKGGKPYKAGKDKAQKAAEKGFGDLGDSKLKFKYETNVKSPPPAKLKVCERVEFASLVAKQIAKDPTLMEDIVKQFKEKGLLSALVVEMFEQKETFRHLSEVMGHKHYGPKVCDKLVRSMKEQTAPNFASQLDGEEHEDDELNANFDEPDDDEMEDEGPDGIDAGMAPEGDPTGLAGTEDPNDPTAQMPPTMDPADTTMNQDPNMGIDPSAAGMDPMMGQQQPPSNMPPAMANFQRAMMRRYQTSMMSKK